MAVRNTSKESYRKLTDLGDKQRELYEVIKKIGPASDRELKDYLDWEINVLLPRRGELVTYGFVKKAGEKYNQNTKRNVTLWVATDPFADRAVQKVMGPPPEKQRSDPKMKYLLKLKNGQRFTINGAMKDEIEEAIAAKRGNRTITLANHVFSLSNIALPITEFGNAPATPQSKKPEATREEILIEVDGEWQATDVSEYQLKREQRPYRSRRIGVESGEVKSDLMTVFDGMYESVRDMLR